MESRTLIVVLSFLCLQQALTTTVAPNKETTVLNCNQCREIFSYQDRKCQLLCYMEWKHLAPHTEKSKEKVTIQTTRYYSFVSCKECFGHGLNPNADPRCKYGCDKYMTYPPTTETVQTLPQITQKGDFISCEECFGHGINLEADPRCGYGCDKYITSPPTTETVAQFTFTQKTAKPTGKSDIPSCKECLGHGINPEADPNCKYACKIITERPIVKRNSQVQKGHQFNSPIKKIIPTIELRFVPLISHEQIKEYNKIVDKLMNGKSSNDERTFYLYVTGVLFCIIFTLICLTCLVICLKKGKNYMRRKFHEEPTIKWKHLKYEDI